MKILFASAECAPFAKVGGLADVVGSLPKALKNIATDVSVILPFYETISPKEKKLIKKEVAVNFKNQKTLFSLWETKLPRSNVSLFLVKNKEYSGNSVYSESGERNAERFLFFSQAAVEISFLMEFDLIHCHDWHTSLIPLILKRSGAKKTLLTVHNIGYQGEYAPETVNGCIGTDFKETVNFLRQGILHANFINTVSKRYSEEILSPEFGFGLEKDLLKRKSDLAGILNGIDEDEFNPEKDPFIKKNYSLKTLNEKESNKKFLQKKAFGKENPSICLLGAVSRLADQKGFDLIKKIFPKIMKENVQFVILGTGSKEYEDFFVEKQKENPEKFRIRTEFNEEFARQIYAGADIFLMPSHFEPCGLGQMIAMRYGTVPVVRATGGLKDTVLPYNLKEGTGFLFENYDENELYSAIKESLKLFQKKEEWQELQKNGMSGDFSWKNSAEKYLKLYEKILEG